jgi:Protein of unknown function (DUF1579)
MKTEPQKEHQWLQRLVGEWTYESECSMEPGKPPEKFEGSESVFAGRPLGTMRGPRRDARRRHGDNLDDARL